MAGFQYFRMISPQCLAVTSRQALGNFLTNYSLILRQSVITCKGVLLPRADCGICWLQSSP